MLGNLFGGAGTYAKAIVAFAGAFGTFLITILAEKSVVGFLPPAWVLLLGTIASALTGIATFAKKNKIVVPEPVEVQQPEYPTAPPAITPGSIVDHVIDTARGTIGNILK